MNNIHKFIILFFIIKICSSCSYENKNTTNFEFPDKCQLIKIGEKTFSPDEKTPADWRNIALLNYPDSSIFLQFNYLTSEINYFDYKTTRFIKQQKLPLYADGLYVSTLDSIYFYSYYKGLIYEFHDLNSTPRIYRLPLEDKQKVPARVNIFNGIYPWRNMFYMSSYILGESGTKKRFATIGYDVKTNKITYDFEYPKEYLKANWGGGTYRLGYTCFDKKHGKILYSFPILHTLEIYDCEKHTLKSVYAGSKYIKSIKAACKDKTKELTNDEQFNYFLENNSYSAIVYDPYRNCYYRIAEITVPSSKKTYFKQNSIIILDERFDKIGESLLPLRYGTTILIAPEGILIPYISSEKSEDESLNFHVFNLVYK